MFVPGQKVICCNADIPAPVLKYVKPLTKDFVYTVRDVVPGINFGGGEGEISIYLAEITNRMNPHNIEFGYNAERFAPMELDEIDELIETKEECYA